MKPVVITTEVIDTYDQAGFVRNMETYGLRNMIKALSIMEILNTEKENLRLALAKLESKRRRASSYTVTLGGALGCNRVYISNVNKFPLQKCILTLK